MRTNPSNQEINFALGAMLLLAINFGVFLQSPHCTWFCVTVCYFVFQMSISLYTCLKQQKTYKEVESLLLI